MNEIILDSMDSSFESNPKNHKLYSSYQYNDNKDATAIVFMPRLLHREHRWQHAITSQELEIIFK